jgi:hypothetical protein
VAGAARRPSTGSTDKQRHRRSPGLRAPLSVSLPQLVALSGNPVWRNQPYGGNAWKGVAELVERLAASLEADRLSEADAVLDALRAARHNTGAVIDKLSGLDRGLGLEPRG